MGGSFAENTPIPLPLPERSLPFPVPGRAGWDGGWGRASTPHKPAQLTLNPLQLRGPGHVWVQQRPAPRYGAEGNQRGEQVFTHPHAELGPQQRVSSSFAFLALPWPSPVIPP